MYNNDSKNKPNHSSHSSLNNTNSLPLIDIAANLTDPVFCGIYKNKQIHPNDYFYVIQRATKVGVEKIMISGTNMQICQQAIQLCRTHCISLSCTVGCHPSECKEFIDNPESYYNDLYQLILNNRDVVISIGELGLDYAELNCCPSNIQKQYFLKQLDLCDSFNLPLFLHNRDSSSDFFSIIRKNRHRFKHGVVHSFNGTIEELNEIISLDLSISLNASILRTKSSCELIPLVPIERLLIETDSPWCDIRPEHYGQQVLRRNEPCNLIQILEGISYFRDQSIELLASRIYDNTNNMFFLNL